MRFAVAAALSAAALVMPGAAMAAPPRDSAVGGGTNGFFQIGLSAHSEADGTDPSGHVQARSRPNGGFPVPFKFGGEVTCLTVSGNEATIKYRFDNTDNPLIQDGGIQIFVQDNGNPDRGQSVDGTIPGAPMDQATFAATNPEFCPPPPPAGYTPSESGNILVRDAP